MSSSAFLHGDADSDTLTTGVWISTGITVTTLLAIAVACHQARSWNNQTTIAPSTPLDPSNPSTPTKPKQRSQSQKPSILNLNVR
ncbi:hypothetical protein BDV06DRAFT_188894 [Aspergillus oleicola]